MTPKDEFSKRLRAAMKRAGMKPSRTELERAFNREWRGKPISLQTATNWYNGKHYPKQDRLPVLAKVLRIDPRILMYGTSDSISATEKRRAWEDRVTYAERETIDTFLKLPTPQRLIVRDIVDAFALTYGVVSPDKE